MFGDSQFTSTLSVNFHFPKIPRRTYFEKPRTTVGWKGLVFDPHLDGSNDINRGLHLARQVLLDINGLGLATATEFLDTTSCTQLS